MDLDMVLSGASTSRMRSSGGAMPTTGVCISGGSIKLPASTAFLESHAACPIGATEEPKRSHGDWIDVEVCKGSGSGSSVVRCSGIAGSVCVVSNIQ